jgi:hypothetical protein
LLKFQLRQGVECWNQELRSWEKIYTFRERDDAKGREEAVLVEETNGVLYIVFKKKFGGLEEANEIKSHQNILISLRLTISKMQSRFSILDASA